jgi:hypothetical protein
MDEVRIVMQQDIDTSIAPSCWMVQYLVISLRLRRVRVSRVFGDHYQQPHFSQCLALLLLQ